MDAFTNLLCLKYENAKITSEIIFVSTGKMTEVQKIDSYLACNMSPQNNTWRHHRYGRHILFLSWLHLNL